MKHFVRALCASIFALFICTPAWPQAAPKPQGQNLNGMHIYIWAGLKSHLPGQHGYPRFLADWSKLLTEHGAVVDGSLHPPSSAELEHTDGGLKNQLYQGGHVVHTGQLFFADELSDEVAHLKPYARRLDVQRVQLPDDMVFNDAHGAAVMLKFEQIKPKSLEAGLVGTAVLHVAPHVVNDREMLWR